MGNFCSSRPALSELQGEDGRAVNWVIRMNDNDKKQVRWLCWERFNSLNFCLCPHAVERKQLPFQKVLFVISIVGQFLDGEF